MRQPSGPGATTFTTRAPRGSVARRTRARRPSAEVLEGRQLLTIAIGEKLVSPPGPVLSLNLQDITPGPDGNLWFTEVSFKVGRITPAGDVTLFDLPELGSPSAITAGPDGNLWFLSNLNVLILGATAAGSVQPSTTSLPAFDSPLRVGRITPTGVVTGFNLPAGVSEVSSITAGPDGNLWIAAGRSIVRFTTAGVATTFPLPASQGLAREITAGPDGNLWFTEAGHDAVGRITPAGEVTEFAIPSHPANEQGGITTGPDGNLWLVVDSDLNGTRVGKLERITPAGAVTEFSLPALAFDVAAGADGNLWVTTGRVGGAIMRVTTGGAVTVFPTPTAQTGPGAITRGPDGDPWFIEGNAGRIARVVLDAPPDAPLTAVAVPSFAATQDQFFTAPLATFLDADPGGQPGDYTARIEWGDGATTDGRAIANDHGGFMLTGSHEYTEAGTFPVKVTIFDTNLSNPGAVTMVTTTATVADAPLIAQGRDLRVYRGDPNPIELGTATDRDADDTFTATIDWGDGTTTPGTVRVAIVVSDPLPGANYGGPVALLTVLGNHEYRADGTYTVHVTIRDGEGTTTVATSTIHYTGPPITEAVGTDVSAPLGNTTGPVPVARFHTIPDLDTGLLPATIDWGDGTAPVAGKVVGANGSYGVVSGHRYARVGTYRVHVTIGAGQEKAEVIGQAIVTAPDLTLGGALDPASDTGASHGDGITSVTQPHFVGIATPGALVQLSARRRDGTTSLPVGGAVADARGNWSIVSDVLAEGTYEVTARASSSDGRPSVEVPVRTGASGGTLTIDRTAPRIGRVALDPRTSRLAVSFGDNLSGMDSGSLLAPGRYVLSRITSAGLRRVPIRSVAVAPGGNTVVLDLGRPLPGGGYVLRVRSVGVRDRAGNALDGEFSGSLPSGDGRPGGDFTARFRVEAGRSTPPRPLFTPAARTPRGPLAAAHRHGPGGGRP